MSSKPSYLDVESLAQYDFSSGGGGALSSLTVEITAAQLIALAGAHIEILPGVPNSAIVVQSAVFQSIPGATPFTSGAASPVLYLTRTACAAGVIADPTTPPGENNFFTGEQLFGNIAFRQGIHFDALTPTIDIESFFFAGDTAEANGSGVSICMTVADALADGDGSLRLTIFYAVLAVV